MNRRGRNPIVWMILCAVCQVICGCGDAVKDGFTGGVEAGISSIVVTLLEESIANARDQ